MNIKCTSNQAICTVPHYQTENNSFEPHKAFRINILTLLQGYNQHKNTTNTEPGKTHITRKWTSMFESCTLPCNCRYEIQIYTRINISFVIILSHNLFAAYEQFVFRKNSNFAKASISVLVSHAQGAPSVVNKSTVAARAAGSKRSAHHKLFWLSKVARTRDSTSDCTLHDEWLKPTERSCDRQRVRELREN